MLNRVLLAIQNSMLLDGTGTDPNPPNEQLAGVVDTILTYLNWILVPLISIAATVGVIYTIVIIAKMVKADNAEQREEAKKKIIFSIVGVAVGVFMIIVLLVLKSSLPIWLGLKTA